MKCCGNATECLHRHLLPFRESCAIASGGAASLLQLAHPYVAFGVSHHSYVQSNVTLRFFKTFEYVLTVAFGDVAAAVRAAKAVRHIHDRVKGQMEEATPVFCAGHAYSAHEEAALLWVLATLIDWSVASFELFVRRLTAEEKEAFYQYHRRVAPVWGVSARLMPETWPRFQRYCARMWNSDLLTVTKPARTACQLIMQPPVWERVLGLHTLEIYTAVLLPPRLRDSFGLRHSRLDRLGGIAFLAVLSMAYSLLPRSFRSWTKYMQYLMRVNHQTRLPLLARFSAFVANTFVRAYFGKP